MFGFDPSYIKDFTCQEMRLKNISLICLEIQRIKANSSINSSTENKTASNF